MGLLSGLLQRPFGLPIPATRRLFYTLRCLCVQASILQLEAKRKRFLEAKRVMDASKKMIFFKKVRASKNSPEHPCTCKHQLSISLQIDLVKSAAHSIMALSGMGISWAPEFEGRILHISRVGEV